MLKMKASDHCHQNETCCKSTTISSVQQTLSELDFERGIWYAAQNNDMDRIRFLLKKGHSVNQEDAAGYTALHYAARNGHEKVCKELLNHGANVNAITKSGRVTPLHRATTQKHIQIVKLLLNVNANTNLQDSDGFTALHRAIMANCDEISKILMLKTNMDLVDKFNCTPRQLAEKMKREHLFF